jgi:hypothetical protein
MLMCSKVSWRDELQYKTIFRTAVAVCRTDTTWPLGDIGLFLVKAPAVDLVRGSYDHW